MLTLTVITVVYNDPSGIEKTLNSLETLYTFIKFEVIVINGSSLPETKQVIETFNFPNIKVKIVHEPDYGIYNAMNKGIALSSKSSFTIFMNSGDIFLKDAGENIAQHISTEEDVIIFPIQVKDSYGNYLPFRNMASVSQLRYRPAVPHQSTLINSNLLKKILYDESFKILADYNFFCVLYNEEYRFKVIKNINPISCFALGGVSNEYKKQWTFLLEIIRVQKQVFGKVSFRYLIVPLIKATLFRFKFIRELEPSLRKFFLN